MLNIPEEHSGKKFYSFSKAGTFNECLHGFDLRYNKKQKGENNFWGELGHMVHEIIERCAKGDISLSDMAPEFKIKWAKREYRMFPQMEASYYSKIYQFFIDFPGFTDEIIGIEDEFYIPIGEDRVLMGFMDLVTRNSHGGITVTDWKISKPFTKEQEKEKKRQLLIYARAIKQIYGVYPEHMVFFFVKENSFYHYKFDKQEMIEALQWMKETIETMDVQEDFPDKITLAARSGIDVNNKKKFDRFFCENLCAHRKTCDSFIKLRNGEFKL